MSLEGSNLDLSYVSDVKNLARRFYNPVLSEAQGCNRITTSYGSSSFITAGFDKQFWNALIPDNAEYKDITNWTSKLD